jgi:hypothetical protein
VAATFAMADKTGNPRFGVIVRYKDAGNYYACYWQTGVVSALRIAKIVNGASPTPRTTSARRRSSHRRRIGRAPGRVGTPGRGPAKPSWSRITRGCEPWRGGARGGRREAG